MKDLPKPSEGELRILQVLWKQGPSTVREVFEQLEKASSIGYTTVLKLMQIMHEKRLVDRDESARSHVYSARLSQKEVGKRFIDNLLHLFDGSKERLVLQILSDEKVSKAELADIREMIAGLTEGN